MPREYFSILGLSPGCYTPREIARRFRTLRAHLDQTTTADADEAHAQRDDLYLAYAALRNPGAQAEYLRALRNGTTPQRELERLIAASIEDDLLRHSRRAAILEEGRRIGLTDFHTQLLIAQIQFSGVNDVPQAGADPPLREHRPAQSGMRFAAAGALAAALFLTLQRWLAA